jgi:hypothetical protein
MQPDRIDVGGADGGVSDPNALPYADRSTPHPDQHGGTGGVTRRDVATIIVKLIGVYMILQGFPAVIAIGQYGFGGLGRINMSMWGYFLGMLGFYLGIGVLLLAFGDRASKWLLPKPGGTSSGPPRPGSPVELQAAAFAVAGVVMIAFWAIPGFVFDTWRYLVRNNPDAPPGQILEVTPFLVRHAMELGLGLWLFYGSKGLSLYWQRLRGSARGPDEGPL